MPLAPVVAPSHPPHHPTTPPPLAKAAAGSRGGKLPEQPGLGGTELTVNAELKVLALLAGWAEGHTLIPPFITQVTSGNPEDLAILLQQDMWVPGKYGPGEKPSVRPGCRWGCCAEGMQLTIRAAFIMD